MEDVKDLEIKKGISPKLETILFLSLFVAIFATLTALASIYDLQISQILTKGNLHKGQYYSTSQFGLFFEAFGSTPIWLAISVAGVIFFWNAPRIKNANIKLDEKGKKVLSIFAMIGCAIVIFGGLFFFVSEICKYIFEHMLNKAYKDNLYVMALEAFIALPMSVLLIFAWKNFSKETHAKLLNFAFVLVCTAAFYLLITIIKTPIGRCRFRTMNYLEDFSYYTPWYVINGKRNLLDFVSDSCKSFPSGHTFSAGVIYSLLSLPSLFKKLDKAWVKAIFYVVCVGYTAIVAISRIMVGAHYMSDVLFGGTIAFLASMLAREIFVCKFSHFTCFKKDKKQNDEPIVETAAVAEKDNGEEAEQ